MPKKKTMRHASALKAKRQNVARRDKNTQLKNRIRTLSKTVVKAIKEKNADLAKKGFQVAQSAWQKATKKNVIHKNTASREIAKMAKDLASLTRK